jgi:hypothetical protein
MKARWKQAILAARLTTICLALGSCAFSTAPSRSRADAVRIAEEKIFHDFAGSTWHYRNTGVSYLPEDRTWVISYREETFGSRCVIEVDDRTGQSHVLMP